MNGPTVTVLMPVYNAEKFLSESIQSILNQTFIDFEFLIINDGSTDKSKEIIHSFNDQRIRYIENNENLKIVSTLNIGIDLSKGKYIARMDADDIADQLRLEKQVNFMESEKDVGICGSWFQTFGLQSRIVETPVDDFSIKSFLFFNSPFCHSTVIFRRELLEKNKLRYENISLTEDYLLWIKLGNLTKMANIPEILLYYRIHLDSLSSLHESMQTENSAIVRTKYFIQRFGEKYSEKTYHCFCNLRNGRINLKIDKLIADEILRLFIDLYNSFKRNHGHKDLLLNELYISFDVYLKHLDIKRNVDILIKMPLYELFYFFVIKKLKKKLRKFQNI